MPMLTKAMNSKLFHNIMTYLIAYKQRMLLSNHILFGSNMKARNIVAEAASKTIFLPLVARFSCSSYHPFSKVALLL